MGKMELEVKVLDIKEEVFRKKIESIGAELIEETNQYLYTYDLPTIYGRFVDILLQLNEPESDIKFETAKEKLRLLFFELDNLIYDRENEIKELVGCSKLENLVDNNELLEVINKEEFKEFMKQFRNNNKKWIRVRQTNDKTTIAVKHILAPNNTNLQQMMENEIEVSSINQANSILEALGFSYKSYQEKRRVSYKLMGHEIDIDSWPGIPTYFEVEVENEEDLRDFLDVLGYKIEDTVSCTADQVYEMYGKSMFDKRVLSFEDYK